MNLVSLVTGFVSVPILCWLIFEVLPGSNDRVAWLEAMQFSNIWLTVITLGLNILLFSLTFLWLFRSKRRYLKEIIGQTMQIGNGADISVSLRGNDEITELCRSINTMSDKLKAQLARERVLEQEKIEIIQGMSHDLRTPITSQRGYLLLLKDRQYQDREEMDSFIAAATAKTEQLSALIEELFDYTRLADETRHLNIIHFDFVQMVRQIALDYTPLMEKANLQLNLDLPKIPIFIQADAEKIARLLDNLFSNASKYTTSQGQIRICLQKSAEQVEFTISNTCQKISEQEISHLFERFYRIEKSRSPRTGGAGLGLAIARRITDLHHGRIFADYKREMLAIHVDIPLNQQPL